MNRRLKNQFKLTLWSCAELLGGFGFFFALSWLFGSFCFTGSFCSLGTSLKAVNAAFDINKLFLSRKERVRAAANVHFNKWVFVAVFPFDSFFGGNRRTGQDTFAVVEVFEHDNAVIFVV